MTEFVVNLAQLQMKTTSFVGKKGDHHKQRIRGTQTTQAGKVKYPRHHNRLFRIVWKKQQLDQHADVIS